MENFTMVDNRIIRTPILDLSSFRVFLLFLSLPPDFFISERRASELIGISRNTFRSAVKRLEDIGAVTVTEVGSYGRCSWYKANSYEKWKLTKADRNKTADALNPFSRSKKRTTGVQKITTHGSNNDHAMVQKMTTINTETNNKTNNKTNNETKKTNFIFKVNRRLKQIYKENKFNEEQISNIRAFTKKSYEILYSKTFFQDFPLAVADFVSSDRSHYFHKEIVDTIMSERFVGDKGARFQAKLGNVISPIFIKGKKRVSRKTKTKQHRLLREAQGKNK